MWHCRQHYIPKIEMHQGNVWKKIKIANSFDEPEIKPIIHWNPELDGIYPFRTHDNHICKKDNELGGF